MGDSERSWDRDDLRVIRALQLAPRASFARIGAVLGMHERTVARRYRALEREGVVRIFGIVNPLAVGQQVWQVRVRCRPDGSEALAHALASRDDVAWVGIAAAGSEVSFSIRTASAARRDLLLTRTLPRTANVLDIDASVVLHMFLGLSSQDWSTLEGLLSAAEAEALAPPAPPVGAGTLRFHPEPYDAALFATLARDGRAGNARLAAAAGISEGRAARRLAALLGQRAVVIDLDLATEAFGYSAGARLLLRVAPARLQEVGEALAALPEVGFVAAMSGRNNLIASVTCRDLGHLYTFTTAHVGSLDGISGMEVLPFMRVVKQAGRLVVDGRLVDPAR